MRYDLLGYAGIYLYWIMSNLDTHPVTKEPQQKIKREQNCEDSYLFHGSLGIYPTVGKMCSTNRYQICNRI